jgi:predicted RNA binding protein YcfA (HicA-like mRNA interferase family)
MATSGRDMVKEMQSAGWELDRIEGSHHIMEKEGVTISVPVHANRDLTKGTEGRIRKDANLPKKRS